MYLCLHACVLLLNTGRKGCKRRAKVATKLYANNALFKKKKKKKVLRDSVHCPLTFFVLSTSGQPAQKTSDKVTLPSLLFIIQTLASVT